jgi:oligopeptide/dipeptide ABC transporter ATP-binding protein
MLQEELLTVRNLRTYFFPPEGVVKAVDDVSLDIPVGKTLGVLGESGCGKSVTALSIMRLIPDPPGKILSGSAIFQGTDLISLPAAKMRSIRGDRVSMIFQEPMMSLNPVYTIGDQISETFIIHQEMSKQESWNRSVEMLRIVGIPAPERRVFDYPHSLSGGMRQRAMIAMALACRPQLLIADEPTTALDVTIQAQILDLMLQLQEEFGMAIMLITHDLGVVAGMSDRVAVMYAGEVIESGPLETVFANPRHPYTLGLMSSIPKLGHKFRYGKHPLHEIKGTVPDLIHLPAGCPFAPRCSFVMKCCHQKRPPLFQVG